MLLPLSRLAEDLFGRLEVFDPRGATYVVRDALTDGVPVQDVVTEGLTPAQQWVGELWQGGIWSIAQEHAATAIVDDLLGLLASRTPRRKHGTVALVCAEGEWHVTPARMAALLWRSAGWEVAFFGGSTPPDHLRSTISLMRADLVAVSCSLPLALPGAARVADALKDLGMPIMGGGRAFGPDRHRTDAVGLHGWAASAADAPAVFKQWMDQPPDQRDRLRTDDEELALELRLPDVVAAAERRLLQRFPPMRSYDDGQRARTREDLGFILQFAAVSLMVDDKRIFDDFVAWLPETLRGHGVPPEALAVGLEALLGVVDDLPRTADLLESARLTLEGAMREFPGMKPRTGL
jgi:methanogenic corrinoid protein MtbC1